MERSYTSLSYKRQKLSISWTCVQNLRRSEVPVAYELCGILLLAASVPAPSCMTLHDERGGVLINCSSSNAFV